MIVSRARYLRKKCKLSAEEVAERMDRDTGMVSKIELHTDTIPLYNLERYANAIGCKVKDLFEEGKYE